MIPVHIRWMTRKDLYAVMAIDPDWSEKDYIQHLRSLKIVGYIAENGGCVVGAMVYELFKGRLHIHKLITGPRRQGIGTQLIEKLKSYLNSRTTITVIVDDDDLVFHLFLKAQGFRCFCIENNQYQFLFKVKHEDEVPESDTALRYM